MRKGIFKNRMQLVNAFPILCNAYLCSPSLNFIASSTQATQTLRILI